jgi:cytosine/adenosine deaminase-related metal-dependent hydrolase
VQIARERGLPLSTHLAEIPEEREFLHSHAGPLQEMWERLGAWEDFPGTFDGSPVAFAKSMGLLDYPTLLAHVNYCDDEDLALLARGKASVVYCPRTHRYFGHPPHRWREMLALGINVAVGTDSCASSPDLNLVDDLRLLHEIAPEVTVEELWQMATINAAQTIQSDVSHAAEFTIFSATSDEPLKEILETDREPVEVWIAGVRRIPPASPC